MTITKKFSENGDKGKILDVFCIKCSSSTKHKIEVSFDEDGRDGDDRYYVSWTANYQVIMCQGCETISFRRLDWFSEDAFDDDNGSRETLYPKRNSNTIQSKPFFNVPTTIRRIYNEVIDAFNSECLTLCSGGLRAIVEGICAAQGVIDGPITVPAQGGATKIIRNSNLMGKIAGLEEKHILTPAGASALNEHRFLGNEALHELTQPSSDQLVLAIEVIEHTLEQLYEIPEKHEALKRKRASKQH